MDNNIFMEDYLKRWRGSLIMVTHGLLLYNFRYPALPGQPQVSAVWTCRFR